MTHADYHSRSELSSTQLVDFLDDPIAFHHWHVACDWPKPEPTPQMQFGTQVHRMIELGGPEHVCVEIPAEVLNGDGHRKGKAWQEWSAEHEGLATIKPGELNPLRIIWEHLNANTFCRKMLAAEPKEQVFLWEHKPTGIACRSMVDVYHAGILVCWKTTRNTGAREFQRDAWALRYHTRLAFYSMAVPNPPEHVVAVAIGNAPGYGVQPYEIDPAWLELGREEMERGMEELAGFDLGEHLDADVLTLSAPYYHRYEGEYVA